MFGRRHRELKIQLPFDTRKVHLIETDDPQGVEATGTTALLRRESTANGLELNAADVAAFKRWKRLR